MKKLVVIAALLALPVIAVTAADGKAIYEKECKQCHGIDGKGQTKMGQKLGAKDYTDAKVQAAVTDEEAFKAVKEGYKNKEGKVIMKPAEDLTDEDIKAAIAYLRKFKK
jgi:mono/diheme cytochrome c family protein